MASDSSVVGAGLQASRKGVPEVSRDVRSRPMTPSSDARNPVELLAEEFLDRKRRGEHPTLQDYLERHPELADEIRDLFPALVMMDDLGESSGARTGPPAGEDGIAPGARLDRLGDYRILREIGRGGM